MHDGFLDDVLQSCPRSICLRISRAKLVPLAHRGALPNVHLFSDCSCPSRERSVSHRPGQAGAAHGPAGLDGGVRGHRGPRRRRAGAGRARACRPSTSSACRTRRCRKRASGCAPRWSPPGLALPARRITVNLAPADLPKEGSHYDLPIALGLMAAIGAIPPDALAGFTVLGELGLDGSIARGRGRAAGRDRRQRARRRPDLPRRLRAGGRLGEPGDGDHRGRLADPARQSFQGHAGAVAPAAEDPRGRRRAARSQGHQGPGERQARARGRRRRRPQSADGRAARRRQVDAGGAAAVDPAAADAGGAARSLDDRLGRGRDRGRRAHQPAAVPRAASFRQHAGAGRRRLARAAGRGLARASRRAVPRRVARVPAAGARLAAPAARERRGRDRARQPSRHLSGALHAGRRHEPVPLRPRQRAGLRLQARRRTRAAPPTIRRGCRARCSTASTCTSRCRR